MKQCCVFKCLKTGVCFKLVSVSSWNVDMQISITKLVNLRVYFSMYTIKCLKLRFWQPGIHAFEGKKDLFCIL